MKNNYIKLIVRLLLATIPGLLLLIFYISTDPFHVIYTYNYCSSVRTPVGLDKDYETTECFIQNNPVYHYNSFIFGSSRSLFYKAAHWEKYIKEASAFHFDASGESIYGINLKVRFLDKEQVMIKNALIVLDGDILKQVKNSQSHLFITDPAVSGQSKLSFHAAFISTFLNYNFLFAYIDLLLSKRVKPYMVRNNLFMDTDNPISYDCTSNEVVYTKYDSLINKSPELFYTINRSKGFYQRPITQQYSSPVVAETQAAMLNEIRDIFKKDGTDYKIVISPLYDQRKLNPKDLAMLNQIFGAENVFDFSGKNDWTQDFHNYYENSHYRPNIADSVMKSVYTDKSKNGSE